jgi:FdhD protein
MLEVEILRIDVAGKKVQTKRDFVAEEKPVHIFVNQTFYATILCTPSNVKALAVGHLMTEGIVKSFEEIKEVKLKDDVCRVKLKPNVDSEKRVRLAKHFQRVILSACGSNGPFRPSWRLPKTTANFQVRSEIILTCVNQLNYDAEIFRKTGGVHAAAIFKANGNRVAFAEDIGRHNAVDKVIGMGLMQGIDLRKCLLALTGRLTADIIMKSAKASVPVVASIAAAVDSGIAIAKQTNLTLIGFVRGKRMNVYSVPERVSL